MTRQRTGFIVTNVCAVVHYTDANGHHHKITRATKAQTADSQKNLTEAQRQVLRTKRAKQIIRDTILELKGSGAGKCKGSIESRLFARVGYTDDQGKRRDVVRAAESRTHARDLIGEILGDLKEHGAQAFVGDRMTFAELAEHFEKHYLKEAEYVGDRKVAGVRSLKPAQAAVKPLKEYFGKRRLKSISYGDLRTYRLARLKAPTRNDIARHNRDLTEELKVTRTIAAVNREMSKLRRMLNIAPARGLDP